MSAALILGLVGGLLVVAFLANRVFGLTRIPDVLVLMMLGVLLGPVLGLVQAGTLAKTTNLLGTWPSFWCCLKAGSSSIFATLLKHFPGSLLLATLAYIFSMALVAVDRDQRSRIGLDRRAAGWSGTGLHQQHGGAAGVEATAGGGIGQASR